MDRFGEKTPWDVLHYAMAIPVCTDVGKKPGAVIELMSKEDRALLEKLTSDMTQNPWNYITYYGE